VLFAFALASSLTHFVDGEPAGKPGPIERHIQSHNCWAETRIDWPRGTFAATEARVDQTVPKLACCRRKSHVNSPTLARPPKRPGSAGGDLRADRETVIYHPSRGPKARTFPATFPRPVHAKKPENALTCSFARLDPISGSSPGDRKTGLSDWDHNRLPRLKRKQRLTRNPVYRFGRRNGVVRPGKG